MNRYKCTACGEICKGVEVLTADNPFIEGESISGCPHCYSAEMLEGACDIEGCVNSSSSGTPMPDGSYTWRCWEHKAQDDG
jgi:hypothetical protein